MSWPLMLLTDHMAAHHDERDAQCRIIMLLYDYMPAQAYSGLKHYVLCIISNHHKKIINY